MSANIFTSGNLPESPTTTPHGQWSHLSGKVFYMTLLVGCAIMSSGKMEMAGLEPAYPNYFIGHPIKNVTFLLVHISITAL